MSQQMRQTMNNNPHDPVAAQQAIIGEFDFLDDWMDKYQHLIDLGRQLPEFPDAFRSDEHILQGCQSNVWFVAEGEHDALTFQATSDAAIVSGLIALVLRIYSGASAKDILGTPPDFIEAIGLKQHLSATRANGLKSMLDRIDAIATEALASNDPIS